MRPAMAAPLSAEACCGSDASTTSWRVFPVCHSPGFEPGFFHRNAPNMPEEARIRRPTGASWAHDVSFAS